MVDEEPKRLEPLAPTKRHLYLLSGNECAFPGCSHRLLNELGGWVGEHVHIRGVKGERFDASMTNEERRHHDNLLLMCHAHHVETNDEKKWTVEGLTNLKLEHEARFRRGLELYELRELPDALIDLTRAQASVRPTNLRRYYDTIDLAWDLTEDEIAQSIAEYKVLIEQLLLLTPRCRSLLGVVIDRGEDDGEGCFTIPWPEIRSLLGISDEELRELLEILKRYKLADWHMGEYQDPFPSVTTCWLMWGELKEFLSKVDGGSPVADLLVSLDFSVMDSLPPEVPAQLT